jgi:hypothetical protein
VINQIMQVSQGGPDTPVGVNAGFNLLGLPVRVTPLCPPDTLLLVDVDRQMIVGGLFGLAPAPRSGSICTFPANPESAT